MNWVYLFFFVISIVGMTISQIYNSNAYWVFFGMMIGLVVLAGYDYFLV